MVARVVSNGTGTNAWAKGGVMIRDSLNGGSTHAMMVMTAHTAARPPATAPASSIARPPTAHRATPTAPRSWRRRTGSRSSGSATPSPATLPPTARHGLWWATTIIAMEDPVHIGLCVTSHAAGEDRTFQFDSISTTGNVTGTWQGAVINAAQFNAAANMYLTVQDSAGKTATATNATVVTAADWTQWKIPMTDLAGVNLSKVKKMVIGIGDKAAPAAGGTGIVFIDDIGYGRSAGE